MDFVPQNNVKLLYTSLKSLTYSSLEKILEPFEIIFSEICYASNFSLGFVKTLRWESCLSKLHFESLG